MGEGKARNKVDRMSWFGGLFGSAKPVLPTTAPPPKNASKNRGVLGENHTAVTVTNVDPTATQLKVVPHPTASVQGGQQGGRRSVKSRKAKGKGKGKGKGKSRSTSRK